MMKARNIVIGQELEVKIIDSRYGNGLVEVEILEGNFKGKCAIVKTEDLIKTEKVKATLEMVKFDSEENRGLTVNVITENEKVLDEIIEEFETRLSDEGFEVDFARCPFEVAEKVADTLYIDFEYGMMAETKKAIKRIWKGLKGDLNLK